MPIKTFYFDNTFLTKDKRFTYLSEDVVSAATTIRVQSIVGFESLSTSSGQIVCFGEIGNEKTEIVRTSNNTALSTTYNEITLRDSLAFDHPQDTKVYIIDWNQVALSRATATDAQKSTLTSGTPIQPDLKEQIYNDATNTTGYGYIEFYDTINSRYSTVSDPIPYAGYADNTVFMIKKRALEAVNETIDGRMITHEFLNEALWQARREYHNAKGKRPFRRKFNVDIGNVSTGIHRVTAPSDLQKPYTAENVYGVRIGDNENMEYFDKKEWDEDYIGVAHATLDATYTVNTSKDLYCTTVRDFDTTGVVSIEGTNVEYNAKGLSGGTLRISTHGSYTVGIGADVWQNASYGLPDHFTVFADQNGTLAIYFNRPIETAYVDMNIYADYYRTLVAYDSDADELDEPEYDMFVHYLSWRIKKKKDASLKEQQDSDWLEWHRLKIDSLNKEYLGSEIRFVPDIDHLPIPS